MSVRWVIVQTAPRKVNYVRQTLRRLNDEGAKSVLHKFVVCDGNIGVDLSEADWPMLTIDGPSGPKQALQKILRIAHPGQEMLILHDDIEPCIGAVTRMLSLKIPDDVAYVSFSDIKEFHYQKNVPFGLHRIPTKGLQGNGFWGAEALLFPWRSIERLNMNLQKVPSQPADMAIGEVFADESYGLHVPSIVNHIGAVSATHDVSSLQGRGTLNFPGVVFDALSLPAYA